MPDARLVRRGRIGEAVEKARYDERLPIQAARFARCSSCRHSSHKFTRALRNFDLNRPGLLGGSNSSGLPLETFPSAIAAELSEDSLSWRV